jgi:hypothetical protein
VQAFLVVVVLVVAATSVWVVVDGARLSVRRGGLGGGLLDIGLVGWFVLCELVWIVGFPLYLLLRRRYVALTAGTASEVRPDSSPADASPTRAPAAWYPDPGAPGGQRWWDGQRWTEHTI